MLPVSKVKTNYQVKVTATPQPASDTEFSNATLSSEDLYDVDGTTRILKLCQEHEKVIYVEHCTLRRVLVHVCTIAADSIVQSKVATQDTLCLTL